LTPGAAATRSVVLTKLTRRLKERGWLGLGFSIWDKIVRTLYRAKLKSIIGKQNLGNNCYFGPQIEIKCGRLKLGDNVYIGRNVVLWGEGTIEIGDHSIISDYVSIFADREVKIGQHCSVASFTFIIDSNHQVDRDTLIHEQPKDTRPIEIGNDVWISASCVIMAGSKIEDGAVIGASSVVSTNIPAYSIALGYPARPLKERS
jgi:acetyltransferase-like isoleucine patch superfamily enzyme